jgi:4-hydroxybenzoyl-CoA thioesterase
MDRLRLSKPKKILFETELSIRVYDLNYANHLSNDAILRLIHETRCQFFNSMGYSELNLGGNGSIMADCSIQFRSQGYYNDQLKVQLGIEDYGLMGFNLMYLFINSQTHKEVAIASTGILSFDYEQNKVAKMPDEVWKKVGLSLPKI